MGRVIERARGDLAAGRAWKARDRLTGALVDSDDDALLDLLAEVHHSMGDHPAAGALWFATGRPGTTPDAARAAWRDRHGHDPFQLLVSLPPRVRSGNRPHVVALRRSVRPRDHRTPSRPYFRDVDGDRPWSRRGSLLAVATVAVLAALLLTSAVGAVTIFRFVFL